MKNKKVLIIVGVVILVLVLVFFILGALQKDSMSPKILDIEKQDYNS